MEPKRYNWILYLIATTILTTIAIQLYWNYKNFEQNKQRVLNEIQLSLDNAVEQYYANVSKKNFLTIVKPKEVKKGISVTSFKITDTLKNNTQIDSLIEAVDSKNRTSVITIKRFKESENAFTQLSKNGKMGVHFKNDTLSKVKVFRGKKASDSLKLVKGIRSIFISMRNDSLNSKQLDSILKKEFNNRNIEVAYNFKFYKEDTLHSQFLPGKNFTTGNIIEAKSTFLGTNKKLKLFFGNPTKEALKRSSIGILLSLLLSLAVISSLFYLLKIINQQKQLAEIKNDLISNITHEFKTPITTVSTALEAISGFNVINNREKTQNYVAISKNQVEKLHLMVEKILETATLNSEKLLLKKENHNLVSLIEKLTKKHQLLTKEKTVFFKNTNDELSTKIDVFHFENAISNLLDNAIKYGGNLIEVTLSSEENAIRIEISDNGKGIKKDQQKLIFDKFYRVPRGNTHEVKGFGIGLYYTKKIIEKHGGSIEVYSKQGKTIFCVVLSK